MATATPPANARFSTYSGAPSLQPSLAATIDTVDVHNSTYTARNTYSEKRQSMYASNEPKALTSATSISSNDPKNADIKSWSGALQRLQDSRLEKQRFVMNDHKTEDLAKLALSAKVERALARRLVGQDAAFSTAKKPLDIEKAALQVEAR